MLSLTKLYLNLIWPFYRFLVWTGWCTCSATEKSLSISRCSLIAAKPRNCFGNVVRSETTISTSRHRTGSCNWLSRMQRATSQSDNVANSLNQLGWTVWVPAGSDFNHIGLKGKKLVDDSENWWNIRELGRHNYASLAHLMKLDFVLTGVSAKARLLISNRWKFSILCTND